MPDMSPKEQIRTVEGWRTELLDKWNHVFKVQGVWADLRSGDACLICKVYFKHLTKAFLLSYMLIKCWILIYFWAVAGKTSGPYNWLVRSLKPVFSMTSVFLVCVCVHMVRKETDLHFPFFAERSHFLCLNWKYYIMASPI